MKFFTKKTKIVFLVIILIGAVLLAYNSLSYQLDYQPLKGNSSSLGSSLITEGFNGSGGSDSTDNNSYYNEIRNNMQKSFEAIAAANATNGSANSGAIARDGNKFATATSLIFNKRSAIQSNIRPPTIVIAAIW